MGVGFNGGNRPAPVKLQPYFRFPLQFLVMCEHTAPRSGAIGLTGQFALLARQPGAGGEPPFFKTFNFVHCLASSMPIYSPTYKSVSRRTPHGRQSDSLYSRARKVNTKAK
jgi:hypothetical protein